MACVHPPPCLPSGFFSFFFFFIGGGQCTQANSAGKKRNEFASIDPFRPRRTKIAELHVTRDPCFKMNTSCQAILLHVLVLNLMWRALGAWQELSGVELDIKDALSILLYGAWKGPWNTWLIDCLLGDKGHKTICYPNDNYHSPPRHSAPNTPLVPLGRAHAPRVLLNPWCATHLSHTTSKHKASYSVTFVVSAWEISFHLIKLRFSKMHMSSWTSWNANWAQNHEKHKPFRDDT